MIFITNGEYPVRDKASGGMRRDSQRKAQCAANPAPSPLGADLNMEQKIARSIIRTDVWICKLKYQCIQRS